MATSGSFTGSTASSYITPKIVWSATQSTTGNTSTITAKLYYSKSSASSSKTYGTWSGTISIGGTAQSFSGVTITLTPGGGDVLVATASRTVSHASDGTLSVAISATGAISSTTLSSTTISSTVTLDTIAKVSSLTVATGTLGTAQTLTVTRQSTSFTHTIVAACGSASTTIASKSTSTSISFTPPLTWASQNTTGTSVSVKYTITTYSGSTSIGSMSYTVSCAIPASVKPSCSVAVSDAMGYVSTYGAYVKGKSKLKVVVTPTTSYGSAIASYSTTANGTKYTTASFTTGVLTASGTITISATVTDGRGRSGSASATATVLDYTNPAISKLTVKRCDADGTENDQGAYVQVTFSATVSSLNSKNTASYELRWKKSSENSYAYDTLAAYNNSYSVTNGTYIFSADTGSSYDVELTATDDFSSTSSTTSVSTAFTLIHWRADGTGMAIGKVSESPNLFEINLATQCNKDIDSTGYSCSGVGGISTTVPAGSALTVNGGIVTGYTSYYGYGTPTLSSVVESDGAFIRWYRNGMIVICTFQLVVLSTYNSTYKDLTLATGLPAAVGAAYGTVNVDGGADAGVRVSSSSRLELRVRATAVGGKTIMGTVVYLAAEEE